MPEIAVNDATCTRCNLCIQDCPLSILAPADNGLPQYIDGGAERCIICGHCVSICPTEALTLSDNRLDPEVPPATATTIDPTQLDQLLRSRRSIRHFKTEPVPRATIEDILDVVRYAPTGTNTQCIEWLIVHDTTEVRRLTGLAFDWLRAIEHADTPLKNYFDIGAMLAAWDEGQDAICRLAPHLIIAHAHKRAVSAKVDGIIALTQFELAASARDLGTCWGGLFQMAVEYWPPLREALHLPKDHDPVYTLLFGSPAFSYARAPQRNRQQVVWR